MNFPLYIAKRYLISASKSTAINSINAIASLGIIAGSMALFVVLSVFSGLINFSLSFSNDFDPDIKIGRVKGKSFLISEQQEKQLIAIAGVSGYSKIIEERVLFMFDGREQVAYLKGVDAKFVDVNEIKKTLYQGEWLSPKTTQVVLGYGIAQKLSLGLFDYNSPFEVFVPKSGSTNFENPENAFSKAILNPVGIYAISEELDSKYVFSNLDLAQELLDYRNNQISGIELLLKPNANEDKIMSELRQIFNSDFSIKTRAQLNDSLYKMLNTENVAVYLLFTLVLIIALFNLIGALIMMILDKKPNLKTLFNLGVEVSDLRKIFLLQGTLLSFVGGAIGLFLGVILILLQQQFEFIMITPTLPYPVVFSFKNVVIVMATISTLGFFASLIASSRVNKKLLE